MIVGTGKRIGGSPRQRSLGKLRHIAFKNRRHLIFKMTGGRGRSIRPLYMIMQSVFSAASRRTNSQGEKKGPGRDGALKTDWTKPWHGAASYGDRMAPAMASGDGRAAWSAGFEAQAAIMEGAPGWLCAGGGTRRVRVSIARPRDQNGDGVGVLRFDSRQRSGRPHAHEALRVAQRLGERVDCLARRGSNLRQRVRGQAPLERIAALQCCDRPTLRGSRVRT
jgi:hypothetical protein